MSTPSSQDPILRIKTPLGTSPAFAVSAFTGREAVSQLFSFQVDLLAATLTPVAFDKLLGQGVTVSMTLPDKSPRHWHGLVRSVAQGGSSQVEDGSSVTAYRLVLVPQLWLLTRRKRSRIFQQQSVPDILKTVLGSSASFDSQGTFEKRDYCVQYRESDFDFISRLMEEEGLFYFFKHSDGQHTMVVGNAPNAHPTVVGPSAKLSYDPGEGGVTPDDRIYQWEKEQSLTSGKVTLWDHTFEMPTSHLEAESNVLAAVTAGTVTHKLSVGGNGALELYDYPGGYAKRFDGVAPGGGDRASDLQKIFQDNRRTVDLRMRAEESGALRTSGASTCPQLASGHKFTLDGHSDGDGDYVVLDVEHFANSGSLGSTGGDDGFTYTNRFGTTPATLPSRPPLATPRPHVAGCQTAVVVGPAGEEIFVDKYGRVKVQFHWDREGKRDANSSCWMRVASTWAGRQWGAVHLPRIGQEVLVDFIEGDPDRPIIVGSVYNADNMPPYVLPDNKTQSGVKSRSTLNGTAANFNEFRFEDKKGSEQVYLHAEKDFDTVVENDETSKIGRDRTRDIIRHDTLVLKNQPKDGDPLGEGNQSLTIHKGNRTVTLKEGNETTTLDKGNHALVVTDGNHAVTVSNGNRTLEVTGNDTTTVKTGNRKVTVADGNETLVVQKGNQSVAIKMGNDETTIDMGNYTLTAKMGNIAIKASLGSITVEAMQGVELKCGQSSVKVDQMGVTVKGMMAKIEGQISTDVKGLMTNVSGSAMLTAKGGVTMIN
ncbi:MAG: type VI secretion system Vgr family protein [Gemmatirosa sp.]